MKKAALIIGTFLCLFSFVAAGQTHADSIFAVKKKLSTFFVKNGKKQSVNQMLELMENNPPAYKEMKKAGSNRLIDGVISVVGGGLIGWTIGGAFRGQPKWYLLGIGVGVLCTTIPFEMQYVRHAKNAIEIYHQGLNETGLYYERSKINLAVSYTGLLLEF